MTEILQELKLIHQQEMSEQQQPIRYGDVFDVRGELGEKPVAPADASMMQAAENIVLGKTQKGAAASAMQSAAAKNERAGFTSHDQGTDIAGDQGVAISETQAPGRRIITESIGNQVVGTYSSGAPVAAPSDAEGGGGGITIGEALEAAGLAAGEKPVEWSDAAAVQAVEVIATGDTRIAPGGVGAAAQSAATLNARTSGREEKTKLGDVLRDASEKLGRDKEATRKDAEGVVGAEVRNDPKMTTYPGGVAASVAAAARLNQHSDK